MTTMPSSGTLTNALGVRRLGWSGATRAAQTSRPAATVSAAATPTRKRPRVATTAVRSAAACLCAQSHHTSRPNDSQSRASAPTRGSLGQSRRHDVCGRHRQNDPLSRGDDLAPVAGRQRLTHPRQQPPGCEERVACRADREDPRAGRAGDVHAEDEDQEGVDLTVEARAQVRRRVAASRDPSVDQIQRERDGRERHQHRDLRGCAERVGDQRRDADGERRPDKGHPIRRAQPVGAVAAGRRARNRVGACDPSTQSMRGPSPRAARQYGDARSGSYRTAGDKVADEDRRPARLRAERP